MKQFTNFHAQILRGVTKLRVVDILLFHENHKVKTKKLIVSESEKRKWQEFFSIFSKLFRNLGLKFGIFIDSGNFNIFLMSCPQSIYLVFWFLITDYCLWLRVHLIQTLTPLKIRNWRKLLWAQLWIRFIKLISLRLKPTTIRYCCKHPCIRGISLEDEAGIAYICLRSVWNKDVWINSYQNSSRCELLTMAPGNPSSDLWTILITVLVTSYLSVSKIENINNL